MKTLWNRSRMRFYYFSIMIILSALPGNATIWFVGPDGEGTDAPGYGTNAPAAFASVSYALTTSTNGDSIQLLGGLHTQSSVLTVDREISIVGTDRMNTIIYFPSNFTAALNIHALQLAADNICISNLTLNRQNFLDYGAVIQVVDIWPQNQAIYDNIHISHIDVVGGKTAILANSKNLTIDNCAIYGQDAANDTTALTFELTGFNGTVNVTCCYISGTLAGNLGGSRVRRAFQIESRVGPERSVGTLNISSNIIYDVREPHLWNHWLAPLTDKVSIVFTHNTVDHTSKTPFTLFAYGSGSAGHEYLKFNSIILRDNLFANLGGTAVGRSDYQAGNFARNFPVSGFVFENNLLFIHPVTAPVDSLFHPLTNDPTWFSGSEFSTNGQKPELRFNMLLDTSPFIDTNHINRNFALNPSSDAGRAGFLSASDGGNLGAWPLHTTSIEQGEPVSITWQSVSNMLYQPQRTTNLTSGTWLNIGPQVTGTGMILTTNDSTANTATHAYRVIIVP